LIQYVIAIGSSKNLDTGSYFAIKCNELASRTSKDLNSRPSPLRQNLNKNQKLDKQINSFHIQITFQRFPQRIPKEFPKNSQNIPKKIPKDSKISKELSKNSQ
jgi:hypothetical protein